MHLRHNVREPTLAYPSLEANLDWEGSSSPTISQEAEESFHRLSSTKNRFTSSHRLTAHTAKRRQMSRLEVGILGR